MPEAARTIVKSPPELWAEISDPAALMRHLGAFGEIRITRLEPEATVAWEGDRASGTVELEPAGWGTRVRVSAQEQPEAAPPLAEELATAMVEPDPPPEPVAAVVEPEPAPEPVTAELPAVTEAPVDEVPEADTEPAGEDSPEAAPRRGFFARVFRRRATDDARVEEEAQRVDAEEPVAEEPAPVAEEPAPVAEDPVSVAEEPAMVEEPVEEQPALVEEPAEPALDTAAILDGMLDSLGAAHHRPFSRG